jgi:transposase
MKTRTVTVDLAKDVFEVLSPSGPTTARYRLSRPQFERFLTSLSSGTEVVMEACGTAHHWGRRCQTLGLVPVLLPTPYVRPYVSTRPRFRELARVDTTRSLERVAPLAGRHQQARRRVSARATHARSSLGPLQRVSPRARACGSTQPDPTLALSVADRRGYNKAVSALANKLARVIWAVRHRDVDFSVTTPAAA